MRRALTLWWWLVALPAVAAGLAAPADRAAAWREVQALVGRAECRLDADCATLPLPEQACGGPSGWIAHATRGTDIAALRRALTGLVPHAPAAASTCEMRPDPGARCRLDGAGSGRCVLRDGPATGPVR